MDPSNFLLSQKWDDSFRGMVNISAVSSSAASGQCSDTRFVVSTQARLLNSLGRSIESEIEVLGIGMT
jgi:hypothetical protein